MGSSYPLACTAWAAVELVCHWDYSMLPTGLAETGWLH